MTQKDQSIDLSILDEKELKRIKDKKERADRVMNIIREHGLDKDKEFMDEIDPFLDELLKQ